MNRHATSVHQNIAAAHIADSPMHEILAYIKFEIIAFRDITKRTAIIPY
jgi:hypothetical protein